MGIDGVGGDGTRSLALVDARGFVRGVGQNQKSMIRVASAEGFGGSSGTRRVFGEIYRIEAGLGSAILGD